jgi:hypothetical protein
LKSSNDSPETTGVHKAIPQLIASLFPSLTKGLRYVLLPPRGSTIGHELADALRWYLEDEVFGVARSACTRWFEAPRERRMATLAERYGRDASLAFTRRNYIL